MDADCRKPRDETMHKVTIYTDGACSKNPGGDGAFAAMLIHPLKTLCISGYIPAPTTNNRRSGRR